MKYNIDNELKNIAKFQGSIVCNLYPLLNMFYKANRCKSDDKVTVKKYSTPGYRDATISTLVIELTGGNYKILNIPNDMGRR